METARGKILSIVIFVALAVAAVAAQVTLRWSGWVVVGVLFVGAVVIAGILGVRGNASGQGPTMPVTLIGSPSLRASAEAEATTPAPLEAEMTVIAAARVRSRTDRQAVLGHLWLLDGGGVVVAIRDPLADALFAAGRFPAERVTWARNDGNALVAIDAQGEKRALVWDLEAPGAIGVTDGEMLEGTLENALERATGTPLAGGRQVL